MKLARKGVISNKLAKLMNNQASSYKNKSTDGAVLYDKKDGGGDVWGICPLDNDPSLVDFNNRASSNSIGSLRRSRRIC